MQGWFRLAAFLSLLISLPIFAGALNERLHGTSIVTLAYDDPATSGEPLKVATLKEARSDYPFIFDHCETSNLTVTPYPNAEGAHQFLVECTAPLSWALGDAFPWLLIPAVAIAVIVLGVGWVVTGFH